MYNTSWSRGMPTVDSIKLKPANTYKHQFQIVDNKVLEIKQLVVHRFRLGDVDDIDVYAAEPLYKWQQSEMGKWVMEHAVEMPIWNRQVDYGTYQYEYAIAAKLQAKDATFFLLKWGNTS
jgi:hypothetical protein